MTQCSSDACLGRTHQLHLKANTRHCLSHVEMSSVGIIVRRTARNMCDNVELSLLPPTEMFLQLQFSGALRVWRIISMDSPFRSYSIPEDWIRGLEERCASPRVWSHRVELTGTADPSSSSSGPVSTLAFNNVGTTSFAQALDSQFLGSCSSGSSSTGCPGWIALRCDHKPGDGARGWWDGSRTSISIRMSCFCFDLESVSYGVLYSVDVL